MGLWTIRYGISGCGNHAVNGHIVPAQELPGFDLAGVFDIRPQAVEAVRERFGVGIRPFPSEEALLQSDLDAVLIATPDDLHARSLLRAVEAGKHVLMEKPLAVTPGELPILEEALALAHQRNLLVTSCHPRRFDPPFLWLKKNTPRLKKRLGPIIAFTFDFSYPRPRDTWKKGRSLLIDHANHEIDLLNFLYGPSGLVARRVTDAFDRYEVTGWRDDGMSFTFRGTRRLRTKKFVETVTIRHDHGSVTMDTKRGVALIENHETLRRSRVSCGGSDYDARGLGVMRSFRDGILEGAANYLTPQELRFNTAFGVHLAALGEWVYAP